MMERAPVAVLGAALLLTAIADRVGAQERSSAAIDEWTVPWPSSRPRDPYVAPDGTIWFVGQTADYAAHLDPATGEFTRFDLDPGTGPHNLIVGEDGMVWYAGNRANHIGRLDPSNGEIEKIVMPDPAAHDPHTLVLDHRGHIWFTVQHGNFVGRLAIGSREIDLVPVPTARSRPYGIVVEPGTGRPWVVEFGSYKLATVDPVTLELEEIDLPREDARPRRLSLSSSGDVFYVDYAGGHLGRYSPGSGETLEWPLPHGPTSRPYAIVTDALDRIWFSETSQPNRISGFDSRTNLFIDSFVVPSGGGSIRHMVYDENTGSVWFGTDANTVGRLTLPTPEGEE